VGPTSEKDEMCLMFLQKGRDEAAVTLPDFDGGRQAVEIELDRDSDTRTALHAALWPNVRYHTEMNVS
jgi:hypothetical protein